LSALSARLDCLPDGRLLYLLPVRDGFRFLYAVRLDPETGRRSGEPLLVHHFPEASRRWRSTGFGNAVVTGMFPAELYETSGQYRYDDHHEVRT
jgi:hypothetical protein